MRSAIGTHNHQSVGAPDQGARSNGGLGLGPVPLDARWGQSNKLMGEASYHTDGGYVYVLIKGFS
jgi:hypothetical protein